MTFEQLRELLRGRRCGQGRDRLAREGNCWVFIGARNGDGYGNLRRQGFSGGAHRYVYSQAIGEIPAGMHVLHTCDNRACVRPNHLRLGTHSDNVHDMFAKRRGNVEGLKKGAEASRRVRMTEWTAEQRSDAARHAAVNKHAGRTLAQSKGKK